MVVQSVMMRTLTAGGLPQSSLWLICIGLLWSQLTLAAPAADQPLSEPQARAALLYNFIKHSRWPNESELDSYRVVFVGEQPEFYREFAGIAAEAKIRGRAIALSRQSGLSELPRAQVLVLARSHNPQLQTVAAGLQQTHTLLVTDRATDRTDVMINYHLHSGNLSFEINKSNIVYEGLKISADVLLYGGTEIEVATLYKEMARSLQGIKQEVGTRTVQLAAKEKELVQQRSSVQQVAKQLAAKSEQLAAKSEQLVAQQHKLELIDSDMLAAKKELLSSRVQLAQREQRAQEMQHLITDNEQTLQQQRGELIQQQQTIEQASVQVQTQQQTISSQRSIIMLVMAVLIFLLCGMLLRLRTTLARERKLLESEAELVAAQAESIEAYENTIKIKNDFLTAINHELRTPMNGIVGAAQVANYADADSLRASMDIVSSTAQDMTLLVEDILTYTEIQAGELSNLPQPAELIGLFDELRLWAQKRCDQKNLQLRWDCDDLLPPRLLLDAAKLKKMLQKILDNAIKFSDIGCIDFSASYRHGEPGGQLIIHLQDTGIGIERDQLPHVFEAFWQSESGYTRRFSGLGIGLSISKSLLDCMGGEITITSPEGMGCEVNLSLPAQVCQGAVIEPQAVAIDGQQPVLVVEDNLINQKILQRMLEKLGYKTVLADDGQEALYLVDRLCFSMILMDLQMPKMDGFTCCREIRNRQGNANQQIPIIAVTANLMESQRALCSDAGMNAYLAKPVRLQDLKQQLKACSPQGDVAVSR